MQSATYSALLADGTAGGGVHMAAAGEQGAEAAPPARRQRMAVPAARAPHTLGQVGPVPKPWSLPRTYMHNTAGLLLRECQQPYGLESPCIIHSCRLVILARYHQHTSSPHPCIPADAQCRAITESLDCWLKQNFKKAGLYSTPGARHCAADTERPGGGAARGPQGAARRGSAHPGGPVAAPRCHGARHRRRRRAAR